MADKAKGKIVAATGAAALGPSDKNVKPHMVEDAMTEAIKQAAREEITDPVEIKKRMMAAREKIKRG